MEGQLKKKETKGYLPSFCWLAAKRGLFSGLCRWGKAKGLAERPPS